MSAKPKNAGRKGQPRRYCVGDVQPVPLQLTWGRNSGEAYGPLQRNSGAWFWLKDRKHPVIKRIIGPLEWIHWLTKRLNKYEAMKKSNE